MLFLYGLLLKILSKLKLGFFFYPLFKRFFHVFNIISLPTINDAKDIISNNTYNKHIKNKTFNFRHCTYKHNIYNVQIIVPVYNSEKYIKPCLNSILSQKTKYKYQIIVVNDGSTDGTNEILKQYSNNSLIKIVEEKNSGSSVARNTGLRFVNSKYVMFVDSDDKLAPGAIQNLLNNIYRTHADVTLGGSYRLFNIGILHKWFCYNNNDNFTPRTSSDIESGSWAKIFKSSLFKDVCFPNGYTFEDMMLYFLIYPRCKRISSIDSNVYFYRYNTSSISHKVKFNDASVDSFLLLNLMMKSLYKYNIHINQYIYNTFLDQVKMTGMRSIYINAKIQKSIFVLICYLYDKYFKHFSTNIISNIPLENSLKNKNFNNYILFCIMK